MMTPNATHWMFDAGVGGWMFFSTVQGFNALIFRRILSPRIARALLRRRGQRAGSAAIDFYATIA
jgi:hypothetical protein